GHGPVVRPACRAGAGRHARHGGAPLSSDQEEPLLITSDMLAGGWHPAVPARVDFERGMRRAPPLILLLIATNVVVFCWEIATGALTSTARVIQAGALTRAA